MTKVINFSGGPAAGKTTMAAELFGHMKRNRLNVEYVSEFAKDLVWRSSNSLEDQVYVFGQQHHRLYMLLNRVDWIITDSPLFLSAFYVSGAMGKFGHKLDEWKDEFSNVVFHTFNLYENLNFFVDRVGRKFIQAGRNEDEETSKSYDVKIRRMMDDRGIPYTVVRTVEEVVDRIGPVI